MMENSESVRRTLLNDVIFKIVFGTPQNERLLRSLLNAVLELEGPDRIVSLELMSGEMSRTYINEKGAVLDVRAKDGQGRLYNVEVQVRGPASYIERSLFYLARLYSEQVERGGDYAQLRRSVAISIVDFVLFPDHSSVHSRFRLYDSRQQLELNDILEIHYLELTKFKRERPLRTPLEKWLHLLRFAELYGLGLEPLPVSIQDEEEMVMALDAMNNAYARDEVRELIEARLKAEWDENTRLAEASRVGLERGIAEGREIGIAQGKAEGIAQGKAEGIAQGKAEGKAEGRAEGMAEGKAEGKAEALAEAARAMRALGMSSEAIFQATGMRLEC